MAAKSLMAYGAAKEPPTEEDCKDGVEKAAEVAPVDGEFEVGQTVEARFGGGEDYFDGTIAAVNGDGTFEIKYDDGDCEKRVQDSLIRPAAGKDKQAAAEAKDWDEEMAAEEEGNQWLYSCIVCGDGGDIVMCDACPRVYHEHCIGPDYKVGRGAWYCPPCTEASCTRDKKKRRPAIPADTSQEDLLEIETLCLSLPAGHFLSSFGTQLQEARSLYEKCTKKEVNIGPYEMPRLRDLASWQRLMKAKLVEAEEREMDSKKSRSRIVIKNFTEDQSLDGVVAQFHEQGISHFKTALTEDQVEAAVAAVEDRCNHVIHVVNTMGLQRILENVGFTTFKLRHVGRYDMTIPAFDAKEGGDFEFLNEQAQWLPAVKKILGEDCDCIYTGVMLSMPGSMHQPWHQDGPHLSQHRHLPAHCLNVFVPLVDLTVANGPTEFVPTTHLFGEFEAPRNPVAVCATAGDAVFMDYRIRHRGLGNNSTEARPLLYITYAKKGWTDKANFSSVRYRALPQLADGSMTRKKDRKELRLEREAKEAKSKATM
jgi:ectoine hydroxylase-related dioxygenase (phytanoyl-CoA dioxygenase family)